MSIILDALRKSEEEKKLQQSSPETDIKRQVLNNDRRTSQGRSSPLNRAVLAGFVLAITGLAALGIYSSLTALKKEKPVEQSLNMPVAARSPAVVKTAPAPTVVATPSSPNPAKTAPAPTVVATPSSRHPAKTAPAPSVVAAPPPSEIAHKGKGGEAVQNSKVAEKTSSKVVFGPPDVDTQHQIIPNQGASFSLEGIIFHLDPDKRLAIMRVGTEGNEATVRIGDALGTWLVKDIELDKVTFSDNAKTIVLKID